MDNKELGNNLENEVKKDESVVLPEMKDNKESVQSNMTAKNLAPADNKDNQVKGKDSLTNADFSSIFNMESEEKKDAPIPKSSAAPVVEVNVEESALPKDKPQSHFNKDAFNSEERLIYEIKPEKEGNPIVVVLFFLLLFGTIVALPYISKKVDFTNRTQPVETQPEENENSDTFFFNRSSVRAKIGNLEFTNFVKTEKDDEYFLTFNITNTSERPYQYDKKYYVVMYENEKLVYRALIHSYNAIGSNAAAEITLTINERGYKSADRFKIEEISTSRYPEQNLTETEGNYKILTCNYHNDSIKYYFLEDKLSMIKETYTESQDESKNFIADRNNYRELSKKYTSIEGFTSNFIVTNDDFTMINEFNHKDIPDATLSNLKNYSFFRYNETKDIVSFEMEARGYLCS